MTSRLRGSRRVAVLAPRRASVLAPRRKGRARGVAETGHEARQREDQDQLEREREGRAVAEAFLAVMSHELRTPVTSIYGSARLLARHPGRADAKELIADIEDESERLWRIIDDLLVLSGVERGLLHLSPEPLLLQRAIDEVVADIRHRYPGSRIEAEVPRGLAPVVADATAVRQVLYNLVSNAAKYAGSAGPILVRVTTRPAAADVDVLDSGPGLGPDPEAVFGLFYRAPHTAKLASGTGIGLYVAATLADAMGATIVAFDRPEGGAGFRLTLPLAPAE